MKHRWDPASVKMIVPQDSPDGCERHERVCLVCGVIKTTVIPAPPPAEIWVEFQFHRGGPVSFERLDCVPPKLREAE